jgi:hypothetical protein
MSGYLQSCKSKPFEKVAFNTLSNSWNVLLYIYIRRLQALTEISNGLLFSFCCIEIHWYSSSIILYKAVLLQVWSGPESSRKLRFSDFLTTAQDGGKVVSLTHRPHLPPGNTPGTHFC